MSEAVIKVEGVSKKYCRTLKHTMLYGAADLTKSFIGLKQQTESLRNGEFWAVNDVSFELKRGECLGLIGPNGSGKSTLLKMLNGIFMPDKGRIEVNGRVGALIEVGAGFHPMLTGRENIYVNGAILGMRKKEVDKKFDEIVRFADIGEFLDMPVKNYSSGMYVRLGFSIAVHCDVDILILDEILAVGDIFFQQKCFEYLNTTNLKNATKLIVSHSFETISQMTNRLMIIGHGRCLYHGDIEEGFRFYNKNFLHRKKTTNILNTIEPSVDYVTAEDKFKSGPLEIDIVSYEIKVNGVVSRTVSFKDEVVVNLRIFSKRYESTKVIVGFFVSDKYGQKIFGQNTLSLDHRDIYFQKGMNCCSFRFVWPNVVNSEYSLTLGIGEVISDNFDQIVQCWLNSFVCFESVGCSMSHGIFSVQVKDFKLEPNNA